MVLGRCRGILQDELHQGGCSGGKTPEGHPLPPPFVTSCHPTGCPKPWLHTVPMLGGLCRAERGRSSFRVCGAPSGGLG